MLLNTDVALRDAAKLVQDILGMTRGHHPLDTSVRENEQRALSNRLETIKILLNSVATVLKHWEERQLAAKVEATLLELTRLLQKSPKSHDSWADYGADAGKLANDIAQLEFDLARLNPLDTPAPTHSSELNGTVLALVIRVRQYDKQLRAQLWSLVRRQISGAGGVALSGATTLLTDFRYDEGARDATDYRRMLFRNEHDPRRLLDERGQDVVLLPPSTNLAGCRYDIQYYFLPGGRFPNNGHTGGAAKSLEVLMQLAWGLTTASPRNPPPPEQRRRANEQRHPCSFWLCAAEAKAWFQGPEQAPGRLQVQEQGAVFDHLSRLVSDEKLGNCLVIHRDLIENPAEGLARWFAPAWRIPYQHRQRAVSSADCLWATAPFSGLPGEEEPVDLAFDATEKRTEYWPREQDLGSAPSSSQRGYRRAAVRVSPRRPLYCHLLCDNAPFPAYLIDYSAIGCRVFLPRTGPLSSVLDKALDRIGKDPPSLHIQLPAGVPWPWELNKSTAMRVLRVAAVEMRKPLAPLRNDQDQPIVTTNDIDLRLRFRWEEGTSPTCALPG